MAIICAVAAFSGAPSASARDATVSSFDGTPITTAFFPAAGLTAGAKAPTILIGHGWGQSHGTDPESGSEDLFGSIGIGPLRHAGFNVLTWDARGFGTSGGTVEVDSPDFEARDVQALINYVAKQPEAKLDAPGDPRLGMSGASYGGGIQLVTAGIDKRVDAIVPDIAWNSLISSLYKNDTVKGGWSTALFGAGLGTAQFQGLIGPAPQAGGLDPHITDAYAQGIATGVIPPDDLEFFRSRGPGDALVNRIRIPTMFTEGTADTLFTLHESIRNYAILRRNGIPTKLVWFCGGHGVCLTNKGKSGHVEELAIAWFKRYLDGDTRVSTGPRFEWVDDAGTWHSGSDYPLAALPPLTGKGSGTLAIAPGDTSGSLIAGMPAAKAVTVAIPPPHGNVPLVGEPVVKLTYSGTGTAATTSLYAQLVDAGSGLVLGNQVTPFKVTLDGQPHTLTLPLEAVAVAATPSSRLQLQLVGGSNLYDIQRAAGAVNFSAIGVELPTVDPTATPPGYGAGGGGATGRRTRLILRPVAGTSRRRARRLAVSVRAINGPVRRLRVTLRKVNGRLIAASARRTVRRRRRYVIRLHHRLARGTYRLTATGTAPSGRRVFARRRLHIRTR